MSLFPDASLSVVLPAYNEEEMIESTVRRCVASLQPLVGTFEVILIDDCSRDSTPAIADELGRQLSNVRVVHNPTNLKQGGSIEKGFAAARFDLVTHNAMDYPFDFDDLRDVLPHFPAADIVVVTRKSYPGVSRARRFVSWGNRTLIRLLFGTRISDYNFVQVYKRSVLDQLRCFSRATAFVTVERIIRAHHLGFRVLAVEAEYHPRQTGASSSGNWRVVRDSVRDMTRLWLELRRAARLRGVRSGGDSR